MSDASQASSSRSHNHSAQAHSALLSLSGEQPEILRNLTPAQMERLSRALDDYLSGMERANPPDADLLLKAHPDLREPLALYLSKLGELYKFAGGFTPMVSADDVDGDVSGAKSHASGVTAQEGESGEDWVAGTNELEVDTNDQGEVRRLGDFRLVRIVGRGGMGIVYEAEQTSLKRRVALKLLPLVSVLDSTQIKRFKNEAQAAARLQHPHIVPVYAVGVVRGVHYYAMRFIDGAPLDQLIAELRHERGELKTDVEQVDGEGGDAFESSPTAVKLLHDAKLRMHRHGTVLSDYRTVIRLGIEAATAVFAAHEEGIVHRDIKPSNLMLDRSGKLWVTDFGLARQQNDKTITASGDVLGTLRYMSPEQAAGQSALVDARSDIYSLGATLYELLALQPAIKGANAPQLLRAIETQHPTSLRQIRPDMPRDLVTVIETAMSKSPRGALPRRASPCGRSAACCAGEPILAKPPALLLRSAKWAVRHARLVTVLTSVAVLAVIVFIAYFIQITTTTRYLRLEAEQANSIRREAEQLVDNFNSRTVLLERPGNWERFRREQLIVVRDYYNQILRESTAAYARRPDMPLLHEIAASQYKIGRISMQLVEFQQGRQSLAEAEANYLKVLAASPESSVFVDELAECRRELGLAELQAGNMKEAQALLKESVEQFRKLSQVNATEYRRERLADALYSLGRYYQAAGDSRSADRALHESIDLLETLIREVSEKPHILKMLTYAYVKRGGLYDTIDAETAQSYYRSALERCERFDKLTESSSEEWLALLHNNIGSKQLDLHDLEGAAASFQKALDRNRRLLDQAPNSSSLKQGLCVSLNNMGKLEERQNHPQESERYFREAIAHYEQMIPDLSNDPQFQHELSAVYNSLAMLQEGRAEASEVDQLYESAIEHQRTAVELARSNAKYHDVLHRYLINYAEWLRKSKRPEKALEQTLARRELAAENGAALLSVAKELAAYAARPAQSGGDEQLARRYADAAFDTLRLVRKTRFLIQSEDLEKPPLVSLKRFGNLSEFSRP
ncbi:MAG: serine/threonine-protein kinase [Pirellulales bacterium]